MSWEDIDGKNLQALRIAVCDIRDSILAKESPEATACPHCSSPNTYRVEEFGTPLNVEEHKCGPCGCEWTIRKPVPVGAPTPSERMDATC